MPQRCFALIPAAGIGLRAGSGSPKQYASLNGEAMLAHTIRAFARAPEIELVAVVLAPGDAWPACAAGRAIADEFPGRLRFFGVGGETRAASVLNGLDALADTARADDWMLVHDAARPCITPRMIADLVAALRDDPVGGLLALPVPDTVKRADAAGRVAATVPREGLWLAQTPQMFRCALLREACRAAPGVTDEAGAIERLGHRPKLVPGSARNLKVTWPADFALAAGYLRGDDA